MKFWEITLDELRDFGREGADIFLEIKKGNTKLEPSRKACRWCPVRTSAGGCPAYTEWMEGLVGNPFAHPGEPQLPDPKRLDPARRWEIVRHADLIRAWLAQLHGDSLQAAIDGNPDPGSKAVIGRRGNRFFRDEKRAERVLYGALGLDAYKPLELIGITEAEKGLKPSRSKPGDPAAWAVLETLIQQAAGSPILVSEDDAREAIAPISDEFDDL